MRAKVISEYKDTKVQLPVGEIVHILTSDDQAMQNDFLQCETVNGVKTMIPAGFLKIIVDGAADSGAYQNKPVVIKSDDPSAEDKGSRRMSIFTSRLSSFLGKKEKDKEKEKEKEREKERERAERQEQREQRERPLSRDSGSNSSNNNSNSNYNNSGNNTITIESTSPQPRTSPVSIATPNKTTHTRTHSSDRTSLSYTTAANPSPLIMASSPSTLSHSLSASDIIALNNNAYAANNNNNNSNNNNNNGGSNNNSGSSNSVTPSATPTSGSSYLMQPNELSGSLTVDGVLSSPRNSANVDEVSPVVIDGRQAAQIIARVLKANWFRRKFKELVTKNPYFSNGRIRNNVIFEIQKTERNYVDCLQTVMTLFLGPIKEKKLLDENAINVIFSNIEQIISANTILLKDIERTMAGWPKVRIGEVFKKMSPFLKLYTVYINNYEESVKLLEQYEKKPKFSQFLEKCYHENAHLTQGLTLSGFLIMPVQRIPRYRLLLTDLLKRTPEDHVEYDAISAALKSIILVASFVNEQKRQSENAAIMLTLQKYFEARLKDFVRPSRSFIKSGKLRVHNDQKKLGDWAKLYLFNDMMIIQPDPDPAKTEINAEECEILLFVLTFPVPKSPEEEALQSAYFDIDHIYKKTRYRYRFFTNNAEEREEWDSEITSALSAYNHGLKQKHIKDLDKIEAVRNLKADRLEVTKMKASRFQDATAKQKATLVKLDNSLTELFEKYGAIFERVKKEAQEREELAKKLEVALQKEFEGMREVTEQAAEIESMDRAFMSALNWDISAFKLIFGKEPSVTEESVQPMILSERLAFASSSSSSSSEASSSGSHSGSSNSLTAGNSQSQAVKNQLNKHVAPPPALQAFSRIFGTNLSSSGGATDGFSARDRRKKDLREASAHEHENEAEEEYDESEDADPEIMFYNPMFRIRPSREWFTMVPHRLHSKYRERATTMHSSSCLLPQTSTPPNLLIQNCTETLTRWTLRLMC